MTGVTLATLPLIAAGICLIVVGIYSMKGTVYAKTGMEPTFLGAALFYGSPAKIAEKYKTHIFPHPSLGSIIRPLSLLWNISGMIYVLRKVIKGQELQLRTCCFGYWAVAFVLSIVWAFVMDREMLVTATVILTMTLSCYILTLKEACQCCVTDERYHGATDKRFVYFVVEGVALLTTWTFMALAMTASMALSYKGGLDSESAQFSGFLTLEESARIGLILDLVAFVVWWILDVAYWGKKTDNIKSVYCVFSLAMFSVAFHNYTPDGVTLSNVIALSSSVLGVAAFATRGKAKTFFLGENEKEHVH